MFYTVCLKKVLIVYKSEKHLVHEHTQMDFCNYHPPIIFIRWNIFLIKAALSFTKATAALTVAMKYCNHNDIRSRSSVHPSTYVFRMAALSNDPATRNT